MMPFNIRVCRCCTPPPTPPCDEDLPSLLNTRRPPHARHRAEAIAHCPAREGVCSRDRLERIPRLRRSRQARPDETGRLPKRCRVPGSTESIVCVVCAPLRWLWSPADELFEALANPLTS